MEHRFYKLEIFVPEDYFAAVRQALWSVDAGHIGEYDRCLSWSRVNSCWRPLEGADPFEGIPGELSQEQERGVLPGGAAEGDPGGSEGGPPL